MHVKRRTSLLAMTPSSAIKRSNLSYVLALRPLLSLSCVQVDADSHCIQAERIFLHFWDGFQHFFVLLIFFFNS